MADARRLIALISSSGVASKVSCFETPLELLAASRKGVQDLAFLCLDACREQVLPLAEALRKINPGGGVVFTSSGPAYIMEAFDAGAQQYLIKPIDKDKLEKTLKAQAERVFSWPKTCPVNARGRQIEVEIDSIMYIEVINHNCLIHTLEGVIETGSTMSIRSFLPLLPPHLFFYCHRSYIVNINHVAKVEGDFIMGNGKVALIRQVEHKKYTALFQQRSRLP